MYSKRYPWLAEHGVSIPEKANKKSLQRSCLVSTGVECSRCLSWILTLLHPFLLSDLWALLGQLLIFPTLMLLEYLSAMDNYFQYLSIFLLASCLSASIKYIYKAMEKHADVIHQVADQFAAHWKIIFVFVGRHWKRDWRRQIHIWRRGQYLCLAICISQNSASTDEDDTPKW